MLLIVIWMQDARKLRLWRLFYYSCTWLELSFADTLKDLFEDGWQCLMFDVIIWFIELIRPLLWRKFLSVFQISSEIIFLVIKILTLKKLMIL